MKNDKQKYHPPLHLMIISFSVLVGSCIVGYKLSEFLFNFTGKPAEIWSYIISCLIGFCIFMILAHLMQQCFGKFFHKYIFEHGILKNTMDAIDKISLGDFNVFVNTERNNPFNDVVEKVNKMACELSSMEKLRQDFISNVSREIQSPLTSINGFAELLKTDALTQEERMHYIDIKPLSELRVQNCR
ncbi:MAG: hypothetical protein LBQ47_05060 [Endomicrobium sp.]|jgi:signal transduction histidine kinase|nr:hypothetical protein [Endomicrobium sp.]